MIKSILAFLLLFGVFFIGFNEFRDTTLKEKWQLAKVVGYSTICATLTLAVLGLFVLLF